MSEEALFSPNASEDSGRLPKLIMAPVSYDTHGNGRLPVCSSAVCRNAGDARHKVCQLCDPGIRPYHRYRCAL